MVKQTNCFSSIYYREIPAGTKIAKITWNNKKQLRTLNTTKALKMRALVIVFFKLV